ncbi:hypothetical protein [Nocardia sp. X0981]
MKNSRQMIVAATIILSGLGLGVAVTPQAAALPPGVGIMHAAPQPAQLSAEEQAAVDNKNAGRPYDRDAYNRAQKKIQQAEKYNGDRNKQKRGKKK